MRLILQRVSSASVRVENTEVGRIASGMLVLVGVAVGDSEVVADRAAVKLSNLRIFDDEAGRMNLDASQAQADFLVVSQFTLTASLSHGRRPSFDTAARREVAEPLVAYLADRLRDLGHEVEAGRFGETMQVELVNDGPVTFVLDVVEESA